MGISLAVSGHPTDEELLAHYRTTGDMAYFGQLYRRHIPLVYGLCLKYLKHAEDAEDAVMQLYEELASRIVRYEILSFRTWLYSVAKNHCLQLLRKEKRKIIVEFDEQIMESEPFYHLFEDGQDEEQLEALRRCMEKLPEPQRISIRKFFLDEMSYADIAEFTGYCLKSVKSYIQNGKRNLKICIEHRTDR
ncbi:MAG: sigma-70 family RNA polymerase sigma factor [Bacteroidales bacterium]|jgi:RNA polymerase sigma-70 factor (ECF subfamily)|nr:sigma-70 family RNA polymerase sigma factor [Bacteroidales bacterium]